MKKDIYVLPHRLGESMATNELLSSNRAKAIYDIEVFVNLFSKQEVSNFSEVMDEFLEYCKNNPTYEETLAKFPSRVFEAELSGEIEVINGIVVLK